MTVRGKKYEAALTHARLLESLAYDADKGVFTWKRQTARGRFGQRAGGLQAGGYVAIEIDRRPHLAHRLAWFYVHGQWPERQIDHINGIRSDNRMANLRDVDTATNTQNQRVATSRNKAGLLGVVESCPGRWSAYIKADGKTRYLGVYDDAHAAHAAYITAKRAMHKGNTL